VQLRQKTERLGSGSRFSNHLNVGLGGEHCIETVPDHRVVIYNHHRNRMPFGHEGFTMSRKMIAAPCETAELTGSCVLRTEVAP
jgi:hypothetical protein